VLVVDDEPLVREVTRLALANHPDLDVVGEARDGEDAVEKVGDLRPQVVVMDVDMPRLDGCAATHRIQQMYPDTRVIALTGHIESEAVTRMIVAGAVGYAVKGSDPDVLSQAVLNAASHSGYVDAAAVPGLFDSVVQLARDESARRQEAERLAHELKCSYQETVRALVAALRSRDRDTEEHGDRVADRVVEVGKRMGLSADQLADIEYGAVFHDIGKIGFPDSILHNTDALTESEWAIIKQHTVVGENIIRPIGFLRNVARIVRHSHEHWDGSGYPDKLVGDQTPLESRIIFACDAFDAMTTQRTYQDAMTHDQAVARMKELSGVHFDPAVVDALLAVLDDEQRTSHVRLA
jgi:ribonuclease P protein subunit RPR2